MNPIALTSIAGIIFIFSPFTDTHWPKWMMFHILAGAYLGYKIGKKYGPIFGVAFCGVIFSGIQAFSARVTYEKLHLVSQVDLSQTAAKAVLAFVLMVWVVDHLSLKSIDDLLISYVVICVGHCLFLIFQRFVLDLDWQTAVGFLPNVSMGPCMLAVLFPLALFRAMIPGTKFRILFIAAAVLFPVVIFLNASSMGFATLIGTLGTFIFIIMARLNLKHAIITSLICVLGLIPLGGFIDVRWSTYGQIDGRMQYWKKFFLWWTENSNHLIGAGTGTFRHFGPNIQNVYNLNPVDGNWWMWAHNDALQILFETGVIGLISATFILTIAISRSYRFLRPDLCAAIVGVFIMCLGNYPLRLAEFACLVMLLIAAAIKLPLQGVSEWDLKSMYLSALRTSPIKFPDLSCGQSTQTIHTQD